MSQPEKSIHKISIKSRSSAKNSNAMLSEILLDGIPLKGVTFFKLELKPRKIARITVELVGNLEDFEIEGDFQIREGKK